MTALHHVTVDAGSLLDVALGVSSVVEQFDALVEQYAPEPVAPTDGGPCETTLHVLLGLVSLRRRIAAALAVDAPHAQAPKRTVAIEGSWLR